MAIVRKTFFCRVACTLIFYLRTCVVKKNKTKQNKTNKETKKTNS